MPSFIRPASLIMFWFHGGSQTSWTSASSTPSIVRILLCASCAIAGPIPQPGAVSVIFTSTFVPPSGRFGQLAIVNQTEIDDVHRNFRVEALPQLVPDRLFIDFAGCCDAGFSAAPLVEAGFSKPERVQIFFGDARQSLVGRDGVAAAEGLSDHARRARGDRRFVSARDLDRVQSRAKVNSVFSCMAVKVVVTIIG